MSSYVDEPPDQQVSDSQRADEPTTRKEEIQFSPREEAALLGESNEQKLRANELFSSAHYSEAIQQYETALSTCPSYLEYEVSVLRSNIAACHLKLGEWKNAIEAATASLEALDRLDAKADGTVKNEEVADNDEEEEDIISPGASKIGSSPVKHGQITKEDRLRIRVKALMRRAKSRSEMGGWSALAGAEEDYKVLAAMPNLVAQDRKVVTQQLRALPPRIETAKQNEMGEMMGKLKELGNGILSPFGLSTDNFKMVKDETSGGYSVQFNQGGK